MKKYIEIYEAFQEKSIPFQLKKMSLIIRNDIIKIGNNFNKEYSIDDFNFEVIINFKKGSKYPYYSNINIFDIIKNPNKKFNIIIEATDEELDVDYAVSIIIHELRHVYDILNINGEYEMLDFIKSMYIPHFRRTEFVYFINLIYLSLEHEIIARHNMLYPLLRWINITDKKELMIIYEKTYIFDALIQLKNFDSEKFIKSFNFEKLLMFTNEFIEKVAHEHNLCEDVDEVNKFYKKWEIYFKEKSNEFLLCVDDMINTIVNDIENEIPVNEEKINFNSSYSEYIGGGARKLFDYNYKKIFKMK